MNLLKRRPKPAPASDPDLQKLRDEWAGAQRRLDVLAQTAQAYQRQGGSENGEPKPG
jgi:hypothetical protein